MTKQRKVLSAEDRQRVKNLHAVGRSKSDLATGYGISIRTVERILEENNIDVVHLRMTAENAKIMEVVRNHKIRGYKKLDEALRIPPLTPENVQLYLNGCDMNTLARHFYISGLHLLQEVAGQVSQEHNAKLRAVAETQSEVPNAQPTTQSMREAVKQHLAS